jgi:citrate lyase subunit beta / citryl-CoA lyase
MLRFMTADTPAFALEAIAGRADLALVTAGEGAGAWQPLPAPKPGLFVRVPGPGAPDARERLAAAMGRRPTGLLVADIETGADIALVDARIAVAEAELGVEHGATRILASVGSTAASLFAFATLPGSSPRLAGLVHDPAALALALGAEDVGDLRRHARAMTVAAARACGVMAIDADPAVDAQIARREGFGGTFAE